MRSFLIALVSLPLFTACSGNTEAGDNNDGVSSVVAGAADTNNVTTPQDVPLADSLKVEPVYTYQTFMSSEDGWGYQILMDGQLYIEQPHIPAIQGNKSFTTPFDAIKVAELAISKIKQGLVPPTITVEELDSLGVLK